MSTKYKVILGGVALIVSFAFGRYSVTQDVRTETKVVSTGHNTENKDIDSNRDVHRETTTTETTKPDGSKERVTKVVDDIKSTKNSKSEYVGDLVVASTESVHVSGDNHSLNVSLLVGGDMKDYGSMVYGGSLTKRVLGPITIGLFGLTNRTGGASIGLNF